MWYVTHILQDYLTGPSASEAILKDMGDIDQYQTTTKHNRVQTMCIFIQGSV